MPQTLQTVHLQAAPLTAEAFAPFGVVLEALEDGTPFTAEEAALDVSAGTPRFYIMQLRDKTPAFTRITRHLRTTQTLMSVGGSPWIIAVAPAGDLTPGAEPRYEDVRAFVVPGDVAITLAKGTWHSGPYFEPKTLAFVNVELADTNVTDHHSYLLSDELGLRVVIDVP
ncbi:ureidoglycolate lyase [Cellulomonas sp. JH27-2]|uniref:ureidoglycolate lyase n=1 Tax=Cellulomonas sp. JH27-2 TaxID=2774139 RepID=UPI00177ED7CC|nr:ureidoglycolate lyase [Cellulomonas sp. JH27-2]MBD8058916.1 ureidoglycolate lyase [Cellulomonas sp. JH27-2]